MQKIHIKASALIVKEDEMQMTVNGERLDEYETYFNDIFYNHIQELIRHTNWGVWFQQDNEAKPHFIVDIYVDTESDYLSIKRVIEFYNKANDPQLTINAPFWNFEKFSELTQQLPVL